jgi:hypothetical protein
MKNGQENSNYSSDYGEFLKKAIQDDNQHIDLVKIKEFSNEIDQIEVLESIFELLHSGCLSRNGVRFLIICSESRLKSTRDSSTQLLGRGDTLKDDAIRALKARLNDSWWVVRCSAMYSLAQLRACSHTEDIIIRYKSYSFIERSWVLRSLTMMRDMRSNYFLLNVFKTARNPNVKYLAAGALAALGFVDYRNYLAERVLAEEHPDFLDTLHTVIEMLDEITP